MHTVATNNGLADLYRECCLSFPARLPLPASLTIKQLFHQIHAMHEADILLEVLVLKKFSV